MNAEKRRVTLARQSVIIRGNLRLIVSALFAVTLFFSAVTPCEARYYRRGKPGDPIVRAIMFGPRGQRAWIDYKGERVHAVPGTALDRDLVVDEIRRESVVCKRKSDRTFLEVPINTDFRPKYHRDWSLWGDAISLWETLELVAYGFGYNVVMHHRSGATVIPRAHADTVERMLGKLTPDHHRYAVVGPVITVLPVQPASANWAKLLERFKVESAERLILRFPDLARPGTVISRGDDFQFVMRQIALGSRTPIAFPKNLHFPVYAAMRVVPYFQILAAVAYLNGMMVIEREQGIEIQPWPEFAPQGAQGQPGLTLPFPSPNLTFAEPLEPQTGFGPHPPYQHPAPLPLDGLPLASPPPTAPTVPVLPYRRGADSF